MSNQQQGLQTPQRNMYNLFDNQQTKEEKQNPSYAFTPCTRLSRMTIDSHSNGTNGRIRTALFQSPASNFNDKLMQVIREEESHPNLNMFLGGDRISMFDKSKDNQIHVGYSEDEDSSDEGDLFSSSLCPMSLPDRTMNDNMKKRDIFDEDDDDHIDEDVDVYDPSDAWLSCIYQDNTTSHNNQLKLYNDDDEEDDDDGDENRPPRFWHNNQQLFEKKTRRTMPQEEDNTIPERVPLREIHLEDYLSDNEDLPAKKKMNLSNGKSHKMRFMRTLSPPRFACKRKGKESL